MGAGGEDYPVNGASNSCQIILTKGCTLGCLGWWVGAGREGRTTQ